MKFLTTTIICFLFPLILVSATQKEYQLKSPDGKNIITIQTDLTLSWSVERNNKEVLANSPLSLTVGNHIWGHQLKKFKVKRESVNEKVSFTVPRKYSETENNFNSLKLILKDYTVEFRAYNDGTAYRFISTGKTSKPVIDEEVCYNFPENFNSYTLLTDKLQNWYEESYTISTIEELPDSLFSITPLMVETSECKVLLADANLNNYPGLYLKPEGRSFKGVLAKYPATETLLNNGNKLYATEREEYLIESTGTRTFPWRVIGLFDKDIDILGSELIYLLSDEKDPEIDYSWIKPGKVLWDWWNGRNIYKVDFKSGVNTTSYMYLIDFASKYKIEYLLMDEGWSDRNDLTKLNPEVDVAAICKYASQKNVGIILWTKWINLDRQMDEALTIMESWGVKGIKIDFMDRNDAKMVEFYHRSARKAAEHKMLVDYHGSYPNKGERRTYPNMMTREGVIGLEYNKFGDKFPSPEHDLIIPYLRMWAGPMDYTPGAMLNAQKDSYFKSQKEPMSMGTRCHQLAMYIVYESPLQMISDSPTKYNENPECIDFISRIPAVWDETVPLDGIVSDYIVIARKKDNRWYLGAMNDDTPRDISIDLSFLDRGEWSAEAYSDGVNADANAKDFSRDISNISSTNNIKIHLAPGGGFAAIISPIKK